MRNIHDGHLTCILDERTAYMFMAKPWMQLCDKFARLEVSPVGGILLTYVSLISVFSRVMGLDFDTHTYPTLCPQNNNPLNLEVLVYRVSQIKLFVLLYGYYNFIM